MRRDEALALLREHKDELHRLGVQSLAIFGSVARDEAGPESDVDILVELGHPMGYFGFFDIQEYLQGLLERPVDLVTPEGLKRQLKDRILKEAVPAA
jgi:uncharacterized protein